MKNVIGIEIPESLGGFGELEPFQGAWARLNRGWMDEAVAPRPIKAKTPRADKRIERLEAAIAKCEPHNGMTVSFHHHLRAGDGVVSKVIEILHRMGFREITLASSSLTSAHDPLVPYVKDGTITRIWSSGIRDGLGTAITRGDLAYPVVIQSHGGRVRAIKTDGSRSTWPSSRPRPPTARAMPRVATAPRPSARLATRCRTPTMPVM